MKAKLILEVKYDGLKFNYERPNEEILLAAIKNKIGASSVALIESHYSTENSDEITAMSNLWCLD